MGGPRFELLKPAMRLLRLHLSLMKLAVGATAARLGFYRDTLQASSGEERYPRLTVLNPRSDKLPEQMRRQNFAGFSTHKILIH